MELRELRPDDLEQAWRLDADSFHVPEERREAFLRWIEPDRHLGIFDGPRLVALTGVHACGQFFGRRPLPMGGVGSMSVAPHQRGRGLARRLLAAALAAMRERGEVISTLFPATTRLYRGMGWELAGSAVWRRLAPAALAALPEPASVRVRPAEAGDRDPVRGCYREFAREVNGCVDRPERWWRRLEEGWADRSHYVAESASGALEGYLVYRQLDGEYSALGGDFGLVVDELVATTRDAALALWRLLGSWASLVDRVVHRGTADDPLLLLLPEQSGELLAAVRWMTRLVDPVAAVAARGFAPELELELALELRDEALAANAGRYVLSLRKGRGVLEPGGRGSLALDAGAFASLFTGGATAALLARSGRLTGGSPDERAALDAAFAGPTPWMLDQF